jgi:ketosteroid isomerase-like protein
MRLLLVALIVLMSQPLTPQDVVGTLLAEERRFAKEAAAKNAVDALATMFADDVAVPVVLPTIGFARTRADAVRVLSANPDNVQGRLTWTPVRGGISADGQHGFTFGYMSLRKADGAMVPIKYVAYWIRKPEGWRVAVYKRVVADQAYTGWTVLAPSLPAALVAPTRDPATVERHRASLIAAEQAFSDEAQKIGLGAAFARHGHDDAVNVGPRSSAQFVYGAAEIGKTIGAGSVGTTSPVRWAADEGALVASSGDLGVTFGYIRQNATPPPGQPAAVPFITIWRRKAPDQPWRYIAE